MFLSIPLLPYLQQLSWFDTHSCRHGYVTLDIGLVMQSLNSMIRIQLVLKKKVQKISIKACFTMLSFLRLSYKFTILKTSDYGLCLS